MSEIEWGNDDPLDGLSQAALKSEAHWWHGRALEMEAKNEKLLELLQYVADNHLCSTWLLDRMRAYGICPAYEVDYFEEVKK